MNLHAAPFLRHCNVTAAASPAVEELKTAILRGDLTETDFVLMDAPLPPLDQTRFRWAEGEGVLLLGVAMPHCAHAPLYKDHLESESLELLLDLRYDRLGYHQFLFNSDGSFEEYLHQPYPEMHSSAYPLLRPTKWETETGFFTDYLGGQGGRWFWVWFDANEVFRYSQTIGFNLCRSRATGEFSAWNYPGGNGAPDASGFGVLHRAGATRAGATHEMAQPQSRESHVATPAADFKLSVTYDSPDNVVYCPLTPAFIGEEMELLASKGITRVHWIDYSDFPAMWQFPAWRANFEKTHAACGELVPCAISEAHKAGLELVVDFKVFDWGVSSMEAFTCDADTPGAVTDLEGHPTAAIPEIGAHQEWTLQANPLWRNSNTNPLATLRFYSDEPVRDIAREEVTLLVSEDNRTFARYDGDFTVTSRAVSRSHQRWTPAGNEPAGGEAPNWVVELTGLKLSSACAALQIGGEPVTFVQRGFMVMEAEDAAGAPVPHTISTRASKTSADTRYSFWKEWAGWANVTDPLLRRDRWNGADLGFALREMPNMPTILEPTYEGARDIWLARIAKHYDDGADAVNIRIFNHHNGLMSYLQFAFAPAVLDAFRDRFGRDPETTPEDYERVRVLRGEAFTDFMRAARKLADARGKKLMTQLESGIEIPTHLDTRMQLHIDWKTWIEEKLVDEVNLKFWTPYSRFVHEEVVPLAAKHGIPVHVVSRNLSGIVINQRAAETVPHQIEDARLLGFAGYNYYEAGDLYERNNAGGIWMKGLAEPVLDRVRERLESP